MASVYEMVTDRIISEMEKGIIPWHKPWFGVTDGAYNRVTRKPYSLLNQCLLGLEGEWASYKQWSSLGGQVRKGEKASPVVFFKPQVIKEKQTDGTEIVKTIPVLKYYSVFHISQVEGVEPKAISKIEHDPIAEAEELKNAYVSRENINFMEMQSNQAYYSPSDDSVVIPLREQFTEIEEFYSTMFHELTHSTGAKSRLNRLETGRNAKFGSETYSKEELVAELGAASICNMLGFETEKSFKNSAAYIQSWLSVLKGDKRFIVSACSKAEKAVNYIKGTEGK